MTSGRSSGAHANPGPEPIYDAIDAMYEPLRDALWLAGLATGHQWSTYECGHGATVALRCPVRCAAHRRMVRLHAYCEGLRGE